MTLFQSLGRDSVGFSLFASCERRRFFCGGFNPSVGILWGLATHLEINELLTIVFQSLGRDSVGFSLRVLFFMKRRHRLFQSLGRDSVGFSRQWAQMKAQGVPRFQSLGRDSVGFSMVDAGSIWE